MNYAGSYIPDKLIRDVYKQDWEAHHIQEQGLPPYARIGSLSGVPIIRVRYSRYPSRTLNFHKFTLVTPLAGETLSPSGRNLYHIPAITLAPREKDHVLSVENPVTERRTSIWTMVVLPLVLLVVSIGLVVYAAVFQSANNNTGQPTATNPPVSATNLAPPLPIALNNTGPYPSETLLQGFSGSTDSTATDNTIIDSSHYYQPAGDLNYQ